MKKSFFTLCFLLSAFCFLSCAAIGQLAKKPEKKIDLSKQMAAEETKPSEAPAPQLPEPKTPEFVPAKEDTSPLQTKTVSISARSTPLREVLFTIAETANLNLVMERGVDTELPVTMTLKNISVEDALNIILDSSDYFYSVTENILTVRAMGTEIFELGHPNVVQEYKMNVGGDILSGTSSVGQSANAVSGDVSIKSSSDNVSFQFWDAIEKTMGTILKPEQGKVIQPAFVVNRMAGTVMVTATKKDLKKVSDYFINLKKVLNRQVLVEARIVEVQLTEGLKYGIDWNALIKGVAQSANINVGTTGFTNVLSGDTPNFQINVTGTENLTLLLKALQEQGDVQTLSNPRINIMNGQTALLSVGRNTSFISKVETVTTTSAGSAPTTTFTVETNSVLSGILFGLVPYINNEGEITLTITPIVTNLVNLEAKIVGTTDNSVEIKLPTVDLREMSTTVRIIDGQIVVIGGLISKNTKSTEKKIPLLGDIPVLGEFFKSVDKTDEQTELVIMLIPRLMI